MELVRKVLCTLLGGVTVISLKLLHWRRFSSPPFIYVSPFSEISLSRHSLFRFGYHSQLKNGAKIRVRNKGKLIIGKYFHSGNNSIIVCRDEISIGDYVQFGPGVLVYDHDHDFSHPDGLKSNHYKCAPVKIGNSVWVGASTIILRGTSIGDNSVIGAGCILKGDYPPNSIIIARQNIEIIPYVKRRK